MHFYFNIYSCLLQKMATVQDFFTLNQSEIILKIQNIMNKSPAEEYLNRLRIFNEFLLKEYDGITIDTLLEKIKDGIIQMFTPF